MAKTKGKKKSATIEPVEDDLDAKAAETVRDISRHLGRALCFTIMAANHPAGGPQEDELLKACDDAWSSLADKVIEFAMED